MRLMKVGFDLEWQRWSLDMVLEKRDGVCLVQDWRLDMVLEKDEKEMEFVRDSELNFTGYGVRTENALGIGIEAWNGARGWSLHHGHSVLFSSRGKNAREVFSETEF